jgi:putative hydrolase of the HAD superfamily
MIRAFLFDMGNVLLHFSHDRMYEQIGQLVGTTGVEARRACERADWMPRYDLRPISNHEMASELSSLLGVALDSFALWRAVSDIFWANQSIEPIVRRLANLGLPMVVVSNTCSAHMQWVIGRFPILDLFPHKILSFEVGASKPAPEIFAAAALSARCPPSECLFVDDNEANVNGARQFGFDAVRYTTSELLMHELESRAIQSHNGPHR